MYTVNEIFSTLQGEGAQAGRAAVFCRFTGCNLWSGREEDRAQAICQFCDTDFVGINGVGGGKFPDANSLANAIDSEWLQMNRSQTNKYLVFTGGEPLLQLDEVLIKALHERYFQIAIETNGTIKPPAHIDWICVSPKNGSRLVCLQGDEIKYVIPQNHQIPNLNEIELSLKRFEKMNFQHFFLQAMDGPRQAENINLAIELCKKRPLWRLSLQQHKLIHLP